VYHFIVWKMLGLSGRMWFCYYVAVEGSVICYKLSELQCIMRDQHETNRYASALVINCVYACLIDTAILCIGNRLEWCMFKVCFQSWCFAACHWAFGLFLLVRISNVSGRLLEVSRIVFTLSFCRHTEWLIEEEDVHINSYVHCIGVHSLFQHFESVCIKLN